MSQRNAKILLIAVFAARGISFLFSRILLRDMSPMSILAVRFMLAFLILAAVFNQKLRCCSKGSLKGGLILGVLYTICMILEMYGLQWIDTGVSALIENMAIVIVPIYAAVLTRTLLFVILTAFTYAVCIMITERVSKNADPLAIGVIQLGTMGVISFIVSVLIHDFALPQTGLQWTCILMLVLICSCFGFAFQPVGQKYLPAEAAAVFTVVNPLTASIVGVAVLGESLSAAKIIGYVLILGALYIYNRSEKA